MSLRVHVVSHTHWDREWYQPAERFRQRLVALIDDLVEDPPGPGQSFLLDGQTIVLDDYLAVRPERRPLVERLIQSGQLECGPWYVLADELIPSGEAIVRNLLIGRRALQGMGASSGPVLYCPDSFGHPACLPDIARGFGLGLIILWRGFGGARWPRADVVTWHAPSGQSVLLYHLPRDGYELGASLPVHPDAASDRWRSIRAALTDRTTLGVTLLLNGADHHARQRNRDAAIASLATAAGEDDVRGSSLTAFARDLIAVASRGTPSVIGELRDSYGYTWALQGTLAARAGQKRRNAAAERMLTREAEPWSVLARLGGGSSRAPIMRAAWQTMLTAHPHDTLCGCSIDEVALAADVRIAAAQAQATGIRDDAIGDLIGHDPDIAAERRTQWRPTIVIRNSVARPRGGVVMVDLRQMIADEPVGPGSKPPVMSATDAVRTLPSLGGVRGVQLIERRIGRDRIESACHYPDNDLVSISRVATWADPVAPLGLACFPIGAPRQQRVRAPNPVRARGTSLDNGLVAIEVDRDGVLSLTDRATGRTIRGLLTLESAPDHGDLYTASIQEPRCAESVVRGRVSHRGPLVGELRLAWRVTTTRGLAQERQLGATLKSVTAVVSLHADSSLVRVSIRGENHARDHRLRVGFRTGIAHASVWADAAFGVVERRPVVVSASDRAVETPPGTAPLHRYVSLFADETGTTVFTDGLAEYEAQPDGHVFVTLLRCVGELSRNDIAERPGHAGWPVPTPDAQSLGPFQAELALLCHAGRSTTTIDAIERMSDDFLLPLEGHTVRNAVNVRPAISGIELRGIALGFSALKEAESGKHFVLRCVNLSDEVQEGEWCLPTPVRDAWMARLDETPEERIPAAGSSIHFRAGPRSIVTILFR